MKTISNSKVLLDTHALLWWLSGDSALSQKAKKIIATDEIEILINAASAWDISTKNRIGKLTIPIVSIRDLTQMIIDQNFVFLSISFEHALLAGGFEQLHKDPVDRMLAAQAISESIPIVSNDINLEKFGATRIW